MEASVVSLESYRTEQKIEADENFYESLRPYLEEAIKEEALWRKK
jgi:hypothetical protein